MGLTPPPDGAASGSGSETTSQRPLIGAAVLVAIIGLAAAVVAWNTTGQILDETVHKLSSVYYSTWFPGGVLHDPWARSTSRLYSVLQAPFVRELSGSEAVQVGRALNALLFASASVPAYLLIRPVVRNRAWACLGAVLVVAVPWLVLTTALFTENLAYPLFLFAALALAEAYRRPAWWRDGIALAAVAACILTRAQLVALLAAYLAVAALGALRLRRPAQAVRAYPFATALIGAGVVVAFAALATGSLEEKLQRFAGPYAATTVDGTRLRLDVFRAVGVQALALSLGTGIVLPVTAAVWYSRALAGRFDLAARACAIAAVSAGGAVAGAAFLSTGGYQGPITEERYFIYVAPLLIIGGIAGIAHLGKPAPRSVLGVGVAVAALLVLVPFPRTLDFESSFFAPAMTAAGWLAAQIAPAGAMSERLVLAAVALAAAVLAWRAAAGRGARARPGAIAVGVAIQLALLAVTYAAVLGEIPGVPARTGSDQAERGFVDRATDNAPAIWIDAQSQFNAPQQVDAAQGTLLYNDGLRTRLQVPGQLLPPEAFPVSVLPFAGLVDPAGGTVTLFTPRRTNFFIAERNSSYVQLAGSTIARSSRFPLDVVRVDGRPRLRWLTTGMGAAGGIPPGERIPLSLWGPARARLFILAAAPTTLRLRRDGKERTIAVNAGHTSFTVSTCGRRMRGTLRPRGQVQLWSVQVTRIRC